MYNFFNEYLSWNRVLYIVISVFVSHFVLLSNFMYTGDVIPNFLGIYWGNQIYMLKEGNINKLVMGLELLVDSSITILPLLACVARYLSLSLSYQVHFQSSPDHPPVFQSAVGIKQPLFGSRHHTWLFLSVPHPAEWLLCSACLSYLSYCCSPFPKDDCT